MSDRLAAYDQFLRAKTAIAQGAGFPCDPCEVNPKLFGFQRDIVAWAVRGGRRGIFTAFGLGKTLIQLEVCRLVLEKSGGSRALIVIPLGVRQEFFRDAQIIGTQIKFVRSDEEASVPGIYLTNYESVREGKIDPTKFECVSLDEAACLRGFGGTKTFREFMRLFEGTDSYRFVATATPSPNEFIELLAYSAFLDVMDVGQAKTRFFKRNSEKADKLTINPHKVEEFWHWVASWALFVQRPSDLGYSDEGYELPELDVRWHEIPSDHTDAGTGLHGQGLLLKDSALGVTQAAREKRDSLPARMAKLEEIRWEDAPAHRVIWHDLEDERRAIENTPWPVQSVYGSQDLDEREHIIREFSDGRLQELAAKPVMLGSGCNFQRHCNWAVFLGIGFKFNDAIQAIHRLQRFGQTKPVRVDFIFTESERAVKEAFLRKWRQHDELVANMSRIIREYGLAESAIAGAMRRTLGVDRREDAGDGWTLVNNDSVVECANMASDSVGLIVTSIPFSTQYEYTPSFNDFGHTDSNAHFWEQMDFLVPELYRILEPGRVCCVHTKDRIVPSGLSGMGFQTVYPFSDDTVRAFTKHGFGLLCRKTVVTDVVRENSQTYRLGWSEQCKDGSRMGAGMPEYVLVFRKPPTDTSNGYADVPVVKAKDDYTRGRWQFDAHGFMRSSGDRLAVASDFDGLTHAQCFQRFKALSLGEVYDFERDVAIADRLDSRGMLPPSFMLLQPQSWHEDVWTDVMRARTLNCSQKQAQKEQHICPLQFDIVDRLVAQFSNPGDLVFDPFSGIGTVVLQSVKAGRRGLGCELSPQYHDDASWHLRRHAQRLESPSLFDLEVEQDDRLDEVV